jgi:hypothetical protein
MCPSFTIDKFFAHLIEVSTVYSIFLKIGNIPKRIKASIDLIEALNSILKF